MIDYLTSALVTLLVVADPLLLSALFLALTHGMSDKERREVALRGPLIAFLILMAAGAWRGKTSGAAGYFAFGLSHLGRLAAALVGGGNGV